MAHVKLTEYGVTTQLHLYCLRMGLSLICLYGVGFNYRWDKFYIFALFELFDMICSFTESAYTTEYLPELTKTQQT